MNTDTLRQQIEDGAESEELLAKMEPFLIKREALKVDAMIAWFLMHPWDPNVALKYMTGLGEIRTQREDLRYKAKKAENARKILFAQTSADADA